MTDTKAQCWDYLGEFKNDWRAQTTWFDASMAGRIRSHVAFLKKHAHPAYKIYEAIGGTGEPSPRVSEGWYRQPKHLQSLCEQHPTVGDLIALEVPRDLIASKISSAVLTHLPFWQSLGACKTHLPLVVELIPNDHVVIRCARCLYTERYVP